MKNCIYFILLIILISNIISKIQFNFTIKEDSFSKTTKEQTFSEIMNFKGKQKLNNLKSYLEAPMGSEEDTKTTMYLCIGSPSQCFNLIILTNSFYVMVLVDSNSAKNYFNISKSYTLYRYSNYLELDYYGEKIIGQKAMDKLTIKYQRISNINFLLVNSFGKFQNIDGFIGFGYMPNKEEKKFSLIEQLFEKGKIAHKVFSQYYYDNYNGVITIGEIPEYIVEDYIHYGRCKAINKIRNGKKYKNNNWECYIDFLYYGNDINNMIHFDDDDYKQEVLFLSYRKRSFLPLYIFNIIGQTYLQKALYQKKCTSYIGGKYQWYECDNNLRLPNLNLVFNEWEIRINSDKLFTPSKFNKNKKDFIFYYKYKFEKFLIGRSLLKEFEMVYDYANKEIGFYYPNVRYLGNEKIGPPKVYTFLDDDDEFKETIVNNSEIFLPVANPEDYNNKYNTLNDGKRVFLSNIFKIIFEILIIICIIIVVGLLAFLVIYRLKMTKKNIIKRNNLYLKNQKLIEMK